MSSGGIPDGLHAREFPARITMASIKTCPAEATDLVLAGKNALQALGLRRDDAPRFSR